MTDDYGRCRVLIEGVAPEIDGGRYAIKRTIGESVTVEADAFCDGHDQIRLALHYRKDDAPEWLEVAMQPLVNDRWRGSFVVRELGRYQYRLEAWVDHFVTWRHDFQKRITAAGSDIPINLMIGADLIDAAAERADKGDRDRLHDWAKRLRDEKQGLDLRISTALANELHELMLRYPDRSLATTYDKNLTVVVDRERARFSTWYEVFPRSCSPEPGRHGTLRDVAELLPRFAQMGFDVLYLPPIHPIGVQFRKGKNNNPSCQPDDVGSPWGIGGSEGGHQAIHPDLGTLADFKNLVRRGNELGIEIALDIAYQCSPDHPWVKDHPQWFKSRPDGTIQYAENPPKKYQDIYPINFETEDWRNLWAELKGVVDYWIEQGVRIFRVDNPHTKAFHFWEWMIGEVKQKHPETIFLSEAFTRPKVMYNLAKLGFTQSYTYFTWRNTSQELREYFTDLTQSKVKEYFRPNLWPNTPDILPEFLQWSGRGGFVARLILAATLGASYGMYGPAFELMEHTPIAPGKEEYLNSEKYEIKQWDWDRPDSLKEMITHVNRIRRENPALHSDRSLFFHSIDNPEMICYSKQTDDGSNIILTIVNLNPYHKHSGWVNLNMDRLGIDPSIQFQVHDLLAGEYHVWQGGRNYVELNPHVVPAHVFRIRRLVRNERDFEYFM